MKINNAVVESVAMKWDDITLPLKEGTPVNIGGNIANNSTAIGLVPVTVYNKPVLSDRISILTSGDVDLAEVEKSFGSALETSAKAAMNGIRFHKADGSIDDSADSSYVLPAATASTLGGVKVGSGLSITSGGVLSASGGGLIMNGTFGQSGDYTTVTFDKSFNELKAALESGKTILYHCDEFPLGGGGASYEATGILNITILETSGVYAVAGTMINVGFEGAVSSPNDPVVIGMAS